MLVFVHIPKAAGTTLHKIITHQYRAAKILIRHDSGGPWNSEELRKFEGARRPDVVMGHLSVGLHELCPGVRYVTCLREPVSRVVSLYHHARNDPTHYLHGPIASGSLTIAEYASSGLSGELSDGMTRMLAGAGDFHEGIVDENTLAQAKSNISNHFDGVVIGEFFDESVLDLAARLGWSCPYYIRRKVGHYEREHLSLSESDREAILSKNQQDRALYEWAIQRFRMHNEFASPDRQRRLADFREKNRRFGLMMYLGREICRRALRL